MERFARRGREGDGLGKNCRLFKLSTTTNVPLPVGLRFRIEAGAAELDANQTRRRPQELHPSLRSAMSVNDVGIAETAWRGGEWVEHALG